MTNTIETLAQRLQTKGGVDQAIETLTSSARLLAGNVSADVLNGIERQRETLVTLQQQLKTGDYIVVENTLSGYGFTSYHYVPVEGGRDREKALGHTNRQSVVELAKRLGLPVVIGDTIDTLRGDWLARTLRENGVVAITEMEH